MADIELILRFFAFCAILDREEMAQQQINLVKYLNIFMKENCNISDKECEISKNTFITTIEFLYKNIGSNIFRTGKKKEGKFVWAKKTIPLFSMQYALLQ